MSEAATEPNATPTIADVLDNLDDVRVPDREGFTTALDHLLKMASGLATEYTRFTNKAKEMAEARVRIRPFMILPNGFPDWAGTSNGYKAAVESAEFSLYVKLGPDAKRRLDQSVRQHVKRSFLLPGIVGYVLTHGNGMSDEATTFESDPDAVLTGPSELLIREVRKHYEAAKLNLPDGTPFAIRGVTSNGGGGPNASDPPSVLKALEDGLGGLAQIVPDIGVGGLLRATSDVSRRLVEAKGSEIKNRPAIIANLHRIAEIASLVEKLLLNQGTPEDENKLSSLYWRKEDAPSSTN